MFEGWSCWIGLDKMAMDASHYIMCQIHEIPMKEWLSWPEHLRMTATGFDVVDWEAVHRVLGNFSKLFWM
jgi:hypothetical protein